MASTAERSTRKFLTESYSLPVAASVNCIKGTLAGLTVGGTVRPGDTLANGCVEVIGMFSRNANNTSGAASAINAEVDTGAFWFKNNSSDIAAADIGADCYVVDNDTVSISSNTFARVRAGTILAVDATLGVLVFLSPSAKPSRIQRGRATLVAGTVTVSNVRIVASQQIFLTSNTPGGTAGFLSAPVASRNAGASTFVINSSAGADTATVDWMVVG